MKKTHLQLQPVALADANAFVARHQFQGTNTPLVASVMDGLWV